MDNYIRDVLIEELKAKAKPSELEKHIIDTANELTKNPFDSQGAERQILSNYDKYPELYPVISCMPNTVQKNICQISDMDRAYILNAQLELLCSKKLGGETNG